MRISDWSSDVCSSDLAQEAGADAALIVTPYYNKPTQAGLYAHYKAIHDATKISIFIYNIPPRCVIDMSVETMAALSKLPRIRGVKDATGDLLRPLKQRRSEEHTSELQSLMRISYAVFCLQKKNTHHTQHTT